MPTTAEMPTRRGLLLGAAANGLAFVAQLAVAFVVAPLLLRHLGRERYGVWSFVESLLAYFTLFDLGLSAALVRYTAKCRADGDDALLNRIVSGCLLIFSGAGLLVIALGLGLFAVILHYSAKVPAARQVEVWRMVVASVLALALSLPLSTFPAVLDGLGRFALKAAIRTLFLALRVAGVLWLIRSDGGLPGLAIVFALTMIAENLVMAAAVRRLLPRLRPAPWRTDRAALRLVRGYGLDSLLAMLAGRIAFKTDAIVIGLCGQLDLIPFFDMPARMVEYARSLVRSATATLTPAVSALEARGGTAAVRELYLTGCRWALYLALPIHLGLILFGGQFLELWLGDAECRLRGQPVLWILAGTLSVGMLQSAAARVLYGVGQIRRFARLMLLEAALNLGLSLALFPLLGINGVALGTMIPNVAMCTWVVVQVCTLLDVSDRTFFRQALAQPLAAAAVLWLVWWRLAEIIPPTTRPAFALLIAGGLAAYGPLVLAAEFARTRLSVSRREPAVS